MQILRKQSLSCNIGGTAGILQRPLPSILINQVHIYRYSLVTEFNLQRKKKPSELHTLLGLADEFQASTLQNKPILDKYKVFCACFAYHLIADEFKIHLQLHFKSG